MRVVIQRVSSSTVTVEDKVIGKIGKGLMILVGFEAADSQDDIQWVSGKICRLRIFDDENGIMNLPVTEVNGELLVVSQFTLHANIKKGNRPSYIRAADPNNAIPLYQQFIEQLSLDAKTEIQTGKFGAHMNVSLINDGPVTIIIDSKNRAF